MLLTIILPVLGLLVNAGFLWQGLGWEQTTGIFGNFNSPWFYGLAVLNGGLLCLPAHRAGPRGRLALLPLALTASYYHERRVLHAALEYTYSPDYAKHYDLDAPALARTLAVVQQHKDNNWDLFMGSQQPYLSAYFNWLVLDNLLLPDSKIADLQKLFLGAGPEAARPRWDRWAPRPSFAENQGAGLRPATLRQLGARSAYSAKEQAWVSWVDLEIANNYPAAGLETEYSTAITLPPGCWVGGYYLDIGARREAGILAERKAATWVYTQILSEHASRDPGLLSYLGPNQLSLRVYPVTGAAVRRTGIQLLHQEPLTLTIDGRSVQLGTPGVAPPGAAPLATPGGAVVYLSAQAKRQLPLVRRQPYYHFLVDVSVGQAGSKAGYVQRVQRLLREQPLAGPARFSLVNTYSAPVPAGADWQRALTDFPNAGGCYLTGAVRRVLTAAQLQPRPTYPRLVVVTDSLGQAVLPADFADLQAAYPESDQFYVLLPSGQLEPHSLRQASAQALPAAAPATLAAVRAWPTATAAQAYLADTETAAIVLPHPAAALAVPAGAPTRWLTGLLLHGFDQWRGLHPEAAERGHVPFIQASFRAGILTPLTAYLALENEAQKAALRRKQAEVLAANANLDAQEAEPPRPSSNATGVPLNSGEWLLLLLGLAFGVRQLRQRYLAAGG